MLALTENPPMSWPTTKSITDDAVSWIVAYCRPHQEKALGWDLCRRDVQYFLPMVTRETFSGGRRRLNLYPLCLSYLFIAGGEADRLVALHTDRVVKLIEVSSSQQANFRSEISALETAIVNKPNSAVRHRRLVPGARERINAGPMKNVQGDIVHVNHKQKLLLGMSVLGVGATVEIHADLVDGN